MAFIDDVTLNQRVADGTWQDNADLLVENDQLSIVYRILDTTNTLTTRFVQLAFGPSGWKLVTSVDLATKSGVTGAQAATDTTGGKLRLIKSGDEYVVLDSAVVGDYVVGPDIVGSQLNQTVTFLSSTGSLIGQIPLDASLAGCSVGDDLEFIGLGQDRAEWLVEGWGDQIIVEFSCRVDPGSENNDAFDVIVALDSSGRSPTECRLQDGGQISGSAATPYPIGDKMAILYSQRSATTDVPPTARLALLSASPDSFSSTAVTIPSLEWQIDQLLMVRPMASGNSFVTYDQSKNGQVSYGTALLTPSGNVTSVGTIAADGLVTELVSDGALQAIVTLTNINGGAASVGCQRYQIQTVQSNGALTIPTLIGPTATTRCAINPSVHQVGSTIVLDTDEYEQSSVTNGDLSSPLVFERTVFNLPLALQSP